MSPGGYGLGPNSNSANIKGNGYPVNKGPGAYGSAQNMPGYGGHAPYGYGNGNGNGYRAPFYGGYSNLMGTHPQKGAGLGYTNGGPSKTQSKQGYGGYPNGGAANQPNTGSSLQYTGYPNGGTKGPKPGYGGYPNGGSANQPNTGSSPQNMGYPNGGTKGPKAGSSLQNMGYPNGGTKGPKPGYGARAGPSNGQGVKPNRYGAKAGPSNGQGAKPNDWFSFGYGGYPNGGSANQPNTGSFLQNMGYPNGGTKGPKAGYGAKAGPTNGQGAKPNGYGVPGYMSKGPYKAANSGYMPVTTGKEGVSSGKGPKGQILSHEEARHLPVTSNTKGFLPQSGLEPNTGLLPEQTKDLPPVLQQTKGQNLHPQGKAPNSMAPQPAPKQFIQGPGSYKPSKAYKPPAPVIPQSKAPKPAAPVVPQAIPVPESAPIPQEYYSQTSQTVSNISPVAPQPLSSQAPLVPESARSTPEMQQTKIQSNQALHQVKNPTTNPELTGLGQVQGAIPSKPDCGPGGQPNGQWVKLPSLGSEYPNGKGAVSSQPGFGMGGYPAHGMNNGYKAGYGGYGNQFKKQAGPQGQQPTGFKGKSQAKYGIGGLPFGGLPNGYQTNPSGQYGNDGQHYGANPYNPKASGKYGHGSLPYNSQPFLPESVAKSPSKYDFGGLPYNGQPLGNGHKGLQYGGQPLDLRPDAVSGKYGESSPESLYNPETLSLSSDAKSAKYGNPAVSYELLGPVTDGQSVDENRSLEALHQGPEIDGHKSIDQYGDGEVPPHPDAPGAGEANAQSIEKYGKGDYTDGRVQPEVVSFPGVPTVGPDPHIPAVTSLDATLSLDGSSQVPVSVPDVSAFPVSPIIPQPELSTLMLQPAPPQQIHIQQHLKFHIQPNGDSQTGNEGKYKLSGFFGNKYQG
ncbi:calymmin [Pseudorasbora parva]|uniref:calymmin n=1 Tax=Pseudorasbora parva TaxID=51549 RepID=UPI00351E40CF